jgi:hypothetical protein
MFTPGEFASRPTSFCRRLALAHAALTIVATLLFADEAFAQQQSTPADPTTEARLFWRKAAQQDVKAAYEMLRSDHPGAAKEPNDASLSTPSLAVRPVGVTMRSFGSRKAIFVHFTSISMS